MKKKLFYFTLKFFILFFENKPFSFKNFLLPLQAFNQFQKLYSIKNNIKSENSNNFIKEYYQKRNQNIKKIIISSSLLFFVKNTFSNSEKKTLKNILRTNRKIILFCFPCHIFEGFFSYIFKQKTNHYPFYRNSCGTSKILHSFDILQEDDKDSEHIKNISKSVILIQNHDYKNKQSSSHIRSYNQPSNKEVLSWQKEFLTNNHKKKEEELLKKVKTSEEELKVKKARYSEELESKSNQITGTNLLMEESNNEIRKLKKEEKILEHNKNEKEKLILTLKNKLISETKRFTETQNQLEKKYTQEKESTIQKIHSLNEKHEKEVLILEHNLETMKQKLAAFEAQKKLYQKEKDNLVKEIEKKEKNLLIFALKIKEQNKSIHERNKQLKELKNCWKKAKEKNNKEAKLSKIDLRPLNNDLLSSLNRIETIREQLGIPPASL